MERVFKARRAPPEPSFHWRTRGASRGAQSLRQKGGNKRQRSLSDNPRCCDANSRRSQRHSEVQSAVQQPPAGLWEDERCEPPGRAAGRSGGGAKAAPPREPQHGRDHSRPPGGAGPDRQPELSLLGPALPLAMQQDAACRLQGQT